MNYYLLFKSLHLISVISWMAGLLYLPRIFVYHAENNDDIKISDVFNVMELGKNGGAGNLIMCKIKKIHIQENVLDTNNMIDQLKIDLDELSILIGGIKNLSLPSFFFTVTLVEICE